jgi:hypothetical protein
MLTKEIDRNQIPGGLKLHQWLYQYGHLKAVVSQRRQMFAFNASVCRLVGSHEHLKVAFQPHNETAQSSNLYSLFML